ncbi:WG repeat-containing protein [Chryseobacterium sp. C39-AII1]|uniref:WG repeat-containing protein n=1 Tax=Chryseobacterium sp. C39-AII1 TaxID=3080332 RepID=UPI003208C3B5
MKKLIFVLISSVCLGQTDQYKQILLSKKLGKEVRSYSKGYGLIIDVVAEKTSIVDSLGVITFDSPEKNEISHLFKNRFILKIKDGERKDKIALIDGKGKELIPLDNQKLDVSWSINERIIASKEGKESVFDYNGKQVIPYSEKIKFAGQNRFFVKNEDGWYIYDADGKKVSDKKFEKNLYFYKNRVYISTGPKQGEIVDNNGQVLNTISHSEVDNIGSYPFLITKSKGNKYGIIDAEENPITEEIYDESFLGTKYIYLIKKDKLSIFSKETKQLYPTEFSYVKSLFNNMFTTQKTLKSPKVAVININGEIVIPKEYDSIEGIKISGENFVYLTKGGEQRFLDKDLKDVLEPGFQIERILPNTLILMREGVFYTYSVKDKKYEELKNIVSLKENGVFYYTETIYPAIVAQNSNGLFGILDEKGKEIIPFQYDDIFTFVSENEIVVKKGDKFGVTNYENEPLKEVIYDKYSVDKQGIKLTAGQTTDYLFFTDLVGEKVPQ